MAKCYNCGTNIPSDDKLRLCDRCKSVLLPFIKFTDASTSSAVARLISNERNLRARGVTDNGMDYLMRICEAHDREKVLEKQLREAQQAKKQEPDTPSKPAVQEEYLEIDLPMSAPLNVHRKPYGTFLTAVGILLLICGLGLLGYTVGLSIAEKSPQFGWILLSVAVLASSYLPFPLKKLIYDVEELKKQFR